MDYKVKFEIKGNAWFISFGEFEAVAFCVTLQA
jgi:hypothetical protein